MAEQGHVLISHKVLRHSVEKRLNFEHTGQLQRSLDCASVPLASTHKPLPTDSRGNQYDYE